MCLNRSVADYSQKFLGNLVLVQLSNIWLSESKSNDPYTQQQAISDLISFLFKEARMGKSSADFKRFMQGQFLNAVISWSDVSPVKEKVHHPVLLALRLEKLILIGEWSQLKAFHICLFRQELIFGMDV